MFLIKHKRENCVWSPCVGKGRYRKEFFQTGVKCSMRGVRPGFHNTPQARQMAQCGFICSWFWGWKSKTSMLCGQPLVRTSLWLQRLTPHSVLTRLLHWSLFLMSPVRWPTLMISLDHNDSSKAHPISRDRSSVDWFSENRSQSIATGSLERETSLPTFVFARHKALRR